MNKFRIAVVALLAATAAVVNGPSADAAVSYRLLMVGDSIGALTYPHVTTTLSNHWDAEPSRAPYTTGANDQATMVQALATLQRQVPNSTSSVPTYIVVQDGGTYDKNGVYVDNATWAQFVNDTLAWTGGRCLIFIHPGYGHTINGVADETPNDIAYARTVAAMNIFANNTHRCIYQINWWAQVNSNPGCVQADGLHPTTSGTGCSGTSGVQWLSQAIEAIIP